MKNNKPNNKKFDKEYDAVFGSPSTDVFSTEDFLKYIDNVLDFKESLSPDSVPAEYKTHTCTFTGHRPERLEIPENIVKKWLQEQINKAVSDGYDRFISGMQRGVDLWAAESVLKLKSEGKNIKLIAACAFIGMDSGKGWDDKWRDVYKNILVHADEVYYIGEKPGKAAFLKRDDWMVDHSSRLIAVYNDAPGGTKHTIDRAEKQGLEVFKLEKQ